MTDPGEAANGSPSHASTWPMRMGPGLAGALAAAFVLVRLSVPAYLDNEMAYSLGPMQVSHPGYLAEQPFLREMNAISLVYNVLMAPVFLILGAFWGSVVCRIGIALFQLWAFRRLARTFGLAPWAQLVALVLWLDTEQSLVAGELVITGAATKPISYGFVFLALDALAREDWRRLPLWCGLATSFHVLVGGWTTLAVGGTLLLARFGRLGWPGLVRFGAIAAVTALPGIVPGILSVQSGDPAVAAEAARVSVLFANPFHQDPAFFLSPGEAIKVVAVFGVTILLARRCFVGAGATLIPVFLGILALCFAAGLAARAVELYAALKYYPFRVADSLFPVLLWAGFAAAFQRWYQRRPRLLLLPVPLLVLGLYNWGIDRTDPEPRRFAAGPRGVADALLRNEPRLTAYLIRTHAAGWLTLARGESDDLRRLEQWARSGTARDAVFITPPWELDWPIRSERATWVSFKILTAGPSILEWKERLEALHGRPFSAVGFGLLKELRESYPGLTGARVRALARRWPADYVVALEEIPDLSLVHREGRYRVYRVEGEP